MIPNYSQPIRTLRFPHGSENEQWHIIKFLFSVVKVRQFLGEGNIIILQDKDILWILTALKVSRFKCFFFSVICRVEVTAVDVLSRCFQSKNSSLNWYLMLVSIRSANGQDKTWTNFYQYIFIVEYTLSTHCLYKMVM